MGPVLRVVVGDSEAPSGIPVDDGASLMAEFKARLSAGHLVRCSQCGALNGRSVVACWSCEANLPDLVLPIITNDAGAWNESEVDRASVPAPVTVSNSVISQTPMMLGNPDVRMTSAFTQQQQPRWGLLTIVGLALLFAGGAAYEVLRSSFFDPPQPAHAIASSAAALPGTESSATPDASVRAPGDLSHVDEALRVAEMLSRTPPPAAVAEEVAPLGAMDDAATRARSNPSASRQGRARNGSRSAGNHANAAAAVEAPPQRLESRPARSPTPALGPCTATVAALGLCASPNQPKE